MLSPTPDLIPTERVRSKLEIPTTRIPSESEIPTNKKPELQKLPETPETMAVKEKPDWATDPDQVSEILKEDQERRSGDIQKWKEVLGGASDVEKEAEERIADLARKAGGLIADIYETSSVALVETIVSASLPRSEPKIESVSTAPSPPEPEIESVPTVFSVPGRYDDFRLPPTPKPPQFSEEELNLSNG